jgi:hypothetical protein
MKIFKMPENKFLNKIDLIFYYINIAIIVITLGTELGTAYGKYLINEINIIELRLASIVYIVFDVAFLFLNYFFFKIIKIK